MKIIRKILRDTVEIDYYIPLTITFPENYSKFSKIQYYQFINNSSAFIEFKIDTESKKIIEIVITSIDSIKEKHLEKQPNFFGDLLVDINSTEIFTENNEFKFYRDNKKIFFLLSNKEISNMNKFSNHVSIFTNKESELSGMLFENFDNKEWEKLEKIIKSKMK